MTATQTHPASRMPSALPPLPADLDRLERYIAMDPGNAPLLMNAIDAALAAGGVAAARKHADAALKLQPLDPFVLHRHGNVLIAEGRLDEAAEVFAALLEQHDDPAIAFNLALVQLRLGHYQDVEATLGRYVATGNANSNSLTVYLRALQHRGETARALEVINTNARQGAGNPEFLAVAALVCLDEDDMAQAAAFSEAALATGARPLEAVVTSASIALAAQNLPRASALFNEALAMRPDDGRSRTGMGMALLLAGDADAAGPHLQRAVQLMPGYGDARHALGWCQVMQRELAQAQATFAEARELDSQASEPHGGLAVVFAMQQRREEAEAAIAAAELLDKQDAGAQFARALLAGKVVDQRLLQSLARRTNPTR